jgi:tyrosine-protein phosphatase SIW14
MNALKYVSSLPVFTFLVLSLPAWCAGPNAPGVPNFHQVNEKIYRGGQPAAEGWSNLAKLGVKTVIDLRRPDEHSTGEEAQAVQAAGMKYVNVPMKGVVAPTEAQVSQALGLLLSSPDPVFVHCKRGSDRTGTIIACYRMSHDSWDHKRALNEAKSLGMSWTQFGLKGYIKSFQSKARMMTMAPATATPVPAATQD